jgi:hypothetical protein
MCIDCVLALSRIAQVILTTDPSLRWFCHTAQALPLSPAPARMVARPHQAVAVVPVQLATLAWAGGSARGAGGSTSGAGATVHH